MDNRFRLGVNYWPADAGMAWLQRYDPGLLRYDFARIAASGMDTVRIFLRWEDLQPTDPAVDPHALAHVVDAADAASETGVDLIVTLFTGHMSGVNWAPRWATGGDDGDIRFRVVSGGDVQPEPKVLRNWYSDDRIATAQADQAGAVASALAGHPAVWAWDLGNENSNCTVPPDTSAAKRWLERITSRIHASDPDTLITIGTHMEDIEAERRIGPAEAARWCDFVCMHGYPIYANWASGPTDPDVVPFLAELTAWLAGEAPILFEEFGHPTATPGDPPSGLRVAEDAAAAYAGRTIDALHAAGCIGALLWCFSDYSAALHDQPPLDLAVHERTFGLWRADGTPKPVVAEIRARQGRSRRPADATRSWLDVTTEEFGTDRRRQLTRLYERYQRYRRTSAGRPTPGDHRLPPMAQTATPRNASSQAQ